MPCSATCSVIGHLYRPPHPLQAGERKGCVINFWTTDRIKVNGAWEKKFTSHTAFVWGNESEWLIRDGAKGTLVAVSGTFQVVAKVSGEKTSYGTEIQAQRAIVMDGKRDDAQAEPAPAPRRAPPAPAPVDDDSTPF